LTKFSIHYKLHENVEDYDLSNTSKNYIESTNTWHDGFDFAKIYQMKFLLLHNRCLVHPNQFHLLMK